MMELSVVEGREGTLGRRRKEKHTRRGKEGEERGSVLVVVLWVVVKSKRWNR